MALGNKMNEHIIHHFVCNNNNISVSTLCHKYATYGQAEVDTKNNFTSKNTGRKSVYGILLRLTIASSATLTPLNVCIKHSSGSRYTTYKILDHII